MLNEGKPDPKHWFFTFGVDTPYGNSYLEVVGVSYEQARRVCMALHNDRWAFQYGPDEFDTSRFSDGRRMLVQIEREDHS